MSDTNFSVDNIPTFVTLPAESFQTNPQKPEQFRIIKNAIIKRLLDGSLWIMNTVEPNETPPQPLEVSYIPTIEEPQQVNFVTTEKPLISDNSDTKVIETPVQKSTTSLYKCPKCKEVFEKIASYRKHMMWHRNVKKFKCDQCSAGYNVETNLKIHMAMHAEGKPTCPICSISFQRLASLKSHLMLHQVEELYTCEDCGAEFDKEEELNKHIQNHLNNVVQENNGLVCSYCNVQFEDKKSYKEHITHHIKVKKMVLSGKKSRKTTGNKNHPHVCSVCLKSFSKLSLLERHLRVHSGERPYVCEYCNKGFNQKGTLQIHLSKHTGIKPFQCTLCSAKFNQKGNLRVHVEKTHTAPMPGVKMYKCPHCTCIFKKIASLNVHIAKCHANSEEVPADITSVMNRLKELDQHTIVTPEMKAAEREVTEQNRKLLNQVKNGGVENTSYVRLAESFLDGTVRRYLVMQKKINDVKWYICNYCSKEFKKPSDLIRHTRVHTREKPFSCKQCGASFALKSTLFYHVKTHVTNSNNCPMCMKKFASMRSLSMHLRKHADKQYKCSHCNKSFTSLQKARLHEKEVHSIQPKVQLKQPLLDTPEGLLPVTQKPNLETTKQHQCSLCNAKFSKLPNLKRHVLHHNGERKHKCEQCSKAYFTAYGLKEHSLCHSGVRNFGCKVCGKRFMTSSLLKRHTASHNTTKPYVCPYCSKSFKSEMFCRRHINVHKKEISAGVQIQKQPILHENDSLELPQFPTTNNLLLSQDNIQPNTIEISNFQLVNHDPDNVTITQQLPDSSIINNIDQQLYEVSPNSIQIITSSDKTLAPDANQVQKILINCEDLQFGDNLYSQNTDAMLFSSLGDLQDNSTFNIDPVGNNFIYNTEIINESDKAEKAGKTKETDVVLTGSIPQYSQSELNLVLLSLDPEFETNNCDLPNDNLNLPDINLNDVPVLNVVDTEGPKESEKEVKEDKKTLSCAKCSKLFSNKRTLTKHMQCHKEVKSGAGNTHPCNFCTKIFKKNSDLVRHIRTHTGEKPFACDKCEKRFSLKSTLLSHQRTHSPVIPKQFNCTVCNSFFSSKSSLKVHMTVHTGDKAHKCNFCPMKFRTAAHRKSHENNFHVNPSKKRTKNKVTNLLASVAMDVLNTQPEQNASQEVSGDLENVLVVQEQLPFSGDQLLLNDTNQTETQIDALNFQQLQPNILLQDNLIPLDCETLFNLKMLDYEEVDVPQGEKAKNFECDVCKKKYSSKDVLRKHKKTHDKKFRCKKCEKGFDTETSLATHEKTHEGYRPYSCFYCANSFSKEHSLGTHMKRIHNVSLKDLLLEDLKRSEDLRELL